MKFTSKTSKTIVTIFIGAIILAFAFTGFEGFNSATDTIAQVGDSKITAAEYQRALNAEINRFSQMFGGKSLTNQQIKQFRLKENTLERLKNQKLIQNLAQDMGIEVSDNEIKEQIKKLDYFQTNKKFDVNKYKNLLRANRLSASRFEQMTANDLKLAQMGSLISSVQNSSSFADEVAKTKKISAKVIGAKLTQSDLVDFISVSKEEITNFIKNKNNTSILNSVFNSMKSEFNKPAKVQARHALFKGADSLKKAKAFKKIVTPKSFARLAGKKTEDESGKGDKGGSLGWFSKGKMVPEFEKEAFSMKPGTISNPVKTQFGHHVIFVEKKQNAVTKKLEDVQDIVAKKHLQKTKKKEQDELANEIKMNIRSYLVKNDLKALKKYATKYKLKLATNQDVSLFSQKAGEVEIKDQDLLEMLSTQNTQKIYENKGALHTHLYKASSVDLSPKLKDESLKSEREKINNELGNKLQKDLIDHLGTLTTSTIKSNLL